MAVCIFSTINQIDAGMLKSALDENNIDNFFKNYHSNILGLAGWTVPFTGVNLLTGDIEVYVKEEDVEEALEIIKTLFGADGQNQTDKGIPTEPGESDYSDLEERQDSTENTRQADDNTVQRVSKIENRFGFFILLLAVIMAASFIIIFSVT
jgi:hypothetical protein